MTLNEMVLEVWNLIGEPTDIDPTDGTVNPDESNVDIGTTGYQRILRTLNQAQIAIVTHKNVRGRQFRWKSGVSNVYSRLAPQAYEITVAGTKGDWTISTDFAGLDDSLNLHLVRVGQTVYRIVDSENDGTLSLDSPLESDVIEGAAIHTVAQPITLPDDLWIVHKIFDTSTQRELERSGRTDSFVELSDQGHSSQYHQVGNTVFFDRVDFDAEHNYLVIYKRMPLNMGPAQQTELPENFHWGLVLWACGWGYWRQQDAGERRNMRDEFEEFMRLRQTEEMAIGDVSDHGATLRGDY